MSIGEQLGGLFEAAGQPGEQKGLTLAKVTNISDPDKLNRVKCLPIGWEGAKETDWCYIMTPFAGKACGQFFFPDVDDLVVLAFLENDPHRPFILGAFWNKTVKSPYVIENGKVYNFSIKTPGKTELLFYDEPKKQRVTLTLPSGAKLEIDDEKESIRLQDKQGDNALLLDIKGGKAVLQAKTKLTLSAGDTSIVLESGGNITQKGKGKISVEGTTVEIKGKSKLALSGATAEVKADATLDMKATGPASLKGAIVKIN